MTRPSEFTVGNDLFCLSLVVPEGPGRGVEGREVVPAVLRALRGAMPDVDELGRKVKT